MISRLDDGLLRWGQDVTLQRRVTDDAGAQTVAFEALCRAVVRAHLPQQIEHIAYDPAQPTKLIMSPTSLTRAAWPGLPARDDRLIINGQPNNVETVSPIEVDGVVVRIDLTSLAFR